MSAPPCPVIDLEIGHGRSVSGVRQAGRLWGGGEGVAVVERWVGIKLRATPQQLTHAVTQ